MLWERWGATDAEVDAPVVGDELLADARTVATRAITLDAPPEDVFPWLRQMGFGRAGWYSHDLVDNLGRRSARRIHPEWQDVSTGDAVPGGPIDFVAAHVDPPRAFVLSIGDGRDMTRRIGFTLAYDLRPDPAGTRLVTRVRIRLRFPGGRLAERFLLGPGDGFMIVKQLRTLEKRCRRADDR